MSGIAQHIIFAVTRIRAGFVDRIGNLSPLWLVRAFSSGRATRTRFWEPILDAAEVAGPDTKFFRVGELATSVFASSDADAP